MKNVFDDNRYYGVQTPRIRVPTKRDPAIIIESDPANSWEEWGANIYFSDAEYKNWEKMSSGFSNHVYMFRYSEINDFRLFYLMLSLYDKIQLISPGYLDADKKPAPNEQAQIINTISDWLSNVVFPVSISGHKYEIIDTLNHLNLSNICQVPVVPGMNPCRINLDQFVHRLCYICVGSGFRGNRKPNSFTNEDNIEGWYHGKVELRFIDGKPIYYAEDIFAAVYTQISLNPPDKSKEKICPMCHEPFEKIHRNQVYCLDPGCNAKTHYNKSPKGRERDIRAINKRARNRKAGES